MPPSENKQHAIALGIYAPTIQAYFAKENHIVRQPSPLSADDKIAIFGYFSREEICSSDRSTG